jgi:hypothetical protein
VYRRQLADLADVVGGLSCHDLAALLALVGLAIELVAVVRILRSVGVGDSAAAWIAQTHARVRVRVGRLFGLPVPVRAHERRLRLAAEAGIAEGLRWTKRRPTDLHPPRDLAEVGERLNIVNLNLNELDQKIIDREDNIKEQLDREAARLRAEINSQTEQLDARVEHEIEERVKSRKAEGAMFSVGVLLQAVGAFILLIVC